MTQTLNATPRFKKLKDVLSDLFEFDQAELDFGIYRIMNAKRDELTRFLDVDLLPQVQTELGKLAGGNRAEVEKELTKLVASLEAAEVPDIENVPKVKEMLAKLAAAADLGALEADIYNDLAGFFKRYYQNGDFLSLRRYKKDVYAIPYEGEEVKLHWANADQYYVKSSEAFRDYTFTLPAVNPSATGENEGRRVHFKLADADTDANNNKAESGKERRFIVADPPLLEENGELTVRFTYRVSGEKQAKLNADAADTIMTQEGFDSWITALKDLRPTEKNKTRTLFDKQLTDYTAKNSFDYFIHKDLRGFLRRELDFFIKNEVLQLDDLETEGESRALAQLARVRAMRGVAHKIIELLAQLENFQKKLWLKKKFVVSTDYCVTLDKFTGDAPELLDEVAGNEAQRREWVQLFAIDELDGYSEPLTRAFLEANPFLVLDTQFYGATFKDKLLSHFDDLDAQTDGLLVKSENFGALNLLQARYKEQVKCIYIDPPYNTEKDREEGRFLYKDGYEHASWLSLISERLRLAPDLLGPTGVFFASIDDNENYRLRELLNSVFGPENYLYELVWNLGTGTQAGHFTRSHEYLEVYAKNKTEMPSFKSSRGGEIRHGALKKISRANPASNITFPEGMDFEGDDAEFVGEVGGSEKQYIEGKMLFRNGKLAEAVTIRAGWAMRNQVLSWLDGKPTFDSKGQRVTRFFFNSQGILWYEKERGTEHPATVLDKIATTKDGSSELQNLFGVQPFSFPKSSKLMSYLGKLTTSGTDLLMDYFAGSGTTAHAAINLNREDGGTRKYILVEMGDYFDTVLKPRIQKVVYSKDWKDGKPVSREGSSQLVKVLRLESYEDALNNLEVKKPATGQGALDFGGDDMKGFREDYLLHYMLDVETRGSASLLNIAAFSDPFAYELNIATSSAGETRPTKVDLIETFNYLLGLKVKTTETLQGFRVVTGETLVGEKVLVIWRNLEEKDNVALDGFFDKQKYNPRDMEFDLIYVNGDNNLQNLRREDETWKVRLIEEEFQRLMFDVRDV